MRNYPDCLPALVRTGIKESDAWALRRIAMQLHRWHELECGTDRGAVERDETTGKTYWINAMSGRRFPTRDMETAALKRLDKVMAKYDGEYVRDDERDPDQYCPQFFPKLGFYVQGDPRGASLYILREGDVPAGEQADAYYSRGLAVYK